MLLGCDSESLVLSNKDPDQLPAIKSKSTNIAANTTTKSSADVFNTITGNVIGVSILHRNENGITINFKTTGLMPGQVSDQITSYEGVCVVNHPAFTEIPDAAGECGDIITSLHRL